MLRLVDYYASWFEAGRRPASNLSATSFESASVMEIGFYSVNINCNIVTGCMRVWFNTASTMHKQALSRVKNIVI